MPVYKCVVVAIFYELILERDPFRGTRGG